MRVSAGARVAVVIQVSPALTTTPIMATSIAAGTAQRGSQRTSSSQTMITGAASNGSCSTAVTGAMQIGNRMPASIAPASGIGMRVIARPSHGQSPLIRISSPHTRKAPIADPYEPVVPSAATSRAAPGVDQAKLSGRRNRHDSSPASTAWPMHSASSPLAASAGLAPTASSPAMTSANELAKPVSAPMTPAMIGCSTLSA